MECLYNNTCKKTCSPKDVESCIRRIKLETLFRESLLTPQQQLPIRLWPDADGTDEDKFFLLKTQVQENITNWVKNGNNLYLYSRTPGNGKTSWSVKLLQEYIYRTWPEAALRCKILFIHVPTFLLELKANISGESQYAEHVLNNVNKADIVVWDDIATKTMTEFECENLLSLIERRLMQGKSNIFTSNVSTDDLYKLVGDRLASRLINKSDTVEFRGTDKRCLR